MSFNIHANYYSPPQAISQSNAANTLNTYIEMFKAAWGSGSIKMSGDGSTAYSSSGSVFQPNTHGPTYVTGSIANPNAWFVVAPPDNSYYLMFKRGVSFDVNWVPYISTEPFSGGSATVTASSPSGIMYGQGSSMLGSSSPSYIGSVCHGIFGDADEEYSFCLFSHDYGLAYSAGSNSPPQMGGMFVDVCKPSFLNAGLNNRIVFGPTLSFGASFGSITSTDETRYDANAYRTPDNNATVNTEGLPEFISGTAVRPSYWTSARILSSGANSYRNWNYMTGSTNAPNTIDISDPCIWASGNFLWADPVIKGESRLFRETSGASPSVFRGRVGPVAFTSDKQFILLGRDGGYALPWDGTTDINITPGGSY